MEKNKWHEYDIDVDDWDKLVAITFKKNFEIFGDGNFCDVGSCDGLFTRFFNQLTNNKVYSFEMNPFNFEKIKSLKSENCIVENYAICNFDGEVDFYSDNQESGNHLSNLRGFGLDYKAMLRLGKVKSIKLDTYFQNIRVKYIKIDVEGSELDVLKGGIETIRNSALTVIECHYDEDWKAIVDICNSSDLKFKNLVTDEDIYYKENTKKIPGRSNVGRPYQMYLQNNFTI